MAPGIFVWFSTALPQIKNKEKKNNKKNEKPTQENRTTTTAQGNNNKQRKRVVVVTSPPKVNRRGIPECLFIVHDDSSSNSNTKSFQNNSDSNSNSWSSTLQIATPDDYDDEDMSLDSSRDDDFAAAVAAAADDQQEQEEQIHYYKTPSPASEQGEEHHNANDDDDDDDDDDEDAFDETTKKENFDGVRSPRRVRMNSRDIPRTYSGLYGDEDLLPFECQRQQRGTITSQSIWFLLFFYVTVVAGVQLVVSPSLLLNHHEDWVWTATNAIHLAVTVPYIHWLKGSIFDPQGEMNALTIWEQLEARGSDSKRVRQLLLIAPTLLCYAACHLSGYRVVICGVNLIFWSIAILAKLPFMNGVRIFGINRTVGIDDTEDNEDETKNKKKVL